MIIKKYLFTIFLPLFLISNNIVFATTYYVDTNAVNDNGSGSASSPKKYIQSGISLMSSSGGDVLILKDGTYSNAQDSMENITSGRSGNYNIIKAENPGAVIIRSGFFLRNGAQYIEINGLKFVSNNSKGMSGVHHIKFRNNAVEGGPLEGNSYTFSIGSNDNTTEYILIEDSWFYGQGGRQNLLVYKADKVVIRRVVLRHDHGWSNRVKTDPEGVGSIYNANNVEIQNLIVLDSSENPSNSGSEWAGGFTVVNNSASGGTCRDNNITGSIIYNVRGNAFEIAGDTNVENIQFKDSVIWWDLTSQDSLGAAIAHGNPGFKTSWAENMTIGGMSQGLTIWGGNRSTSNIKNSIITGIRAFPIGTPSSSEGTINNTFNNCYNNNSENCSSTGKISTNPLANGLMYVTRIEEGSALLTSGENGGRMGAVIVNKLGTTGTLWGESGYNTMTNDPLWPWPNEDRIHNDMSSVDTRGFAANGQTLTNYLWSILGNEPPSDFIENASLPRPQNVNVVKNTN